MKRLIAALCVLLALPGLFFFAILRQPVPSLKTEVFVEIPRGSSTLRIGEILEKAGLLRSPLQAVAYRIFHPGSKYQAGDYVFRRETSAETILSKIVKGDVYFGELTVPEGSSIYDIARIVEERQLLKSVDFLAAAKDPTMIRDLDPDAPTLEGYLYPSTYRLPKRMTAEMLCQRMTRQFREVWRQLHSAEPPHSIVTLASLVEKESAVPEERALIAGLFLNRLAQGMKLECDPTVIYAALVENRFRGTIYKSDLANQSPYNSYQHTGLPPGPIANPGLQSLNAVLHPATTDAVFFVAEPGATGRHVFSKSLNDHNRAVEAYRSGKKR